MTLPLYKQVYNDLKKSIEDSVYPVDTQLPTDSELTQKYGVSKITIKNAMEMLKKDNLISRKPRKGTFVINSSSPKVTNQTNEKTVTIGVIITDFNEYFGNELLKSMMMHNAETINCILKLSKGDPKKEEALINQLISQGVDGLVLLPASSDYFSSKLLELISSDFPLVLVDRMMDQIPACNVSIDNKAAAYDLTKHLIDSGHKNIGIITANKKLSTNEDRVEGFINAHLKYNISITQSQILGNMQSMAPERNTTPDQDVMKIKKFLKDNPNITALFAGEYAIALLIKQAIEEMGHPITDDYSVVCFDHSPLDMFEKNQFIFDHIHQDQYTIGKETMKLIIEKINKPALIKKVSIPHKLKLGNSVKKIADSKRAEDSNE